jgi:hypothetical protein
LKQRGERLEPPRRSSPAPHPGPRLARKKTLHPADSVTILGTVTTARAVRAGPFDHIPSCSSLAPPVPTLAAVFPPSSYWRSR